MTHIVHAAAEDIRSEDSLLLRDRVFAYQKDLVHEKV